MVLSSVFHFLTQYNQVQMAWLKPLSLVKTSLVMIVLPLFLGTIFSMAMVFLPCFNVLKLRKKVLQSLVIKLRTQNVLVLLSLTTI